MKTILVDAVNCFVSEDGEIFDGIHELLEQYPNKKIVVTNANDEQFARFKLDTVPYDVFTLKHAPEKTDPTYFRVLLDQYSLAVDDVVYVEHAPAAVASAVSLGIATYHYDHEKQDLAALKFFLDTNV